LLIRIRIRRYLLLGRLSALLIHVLNRAKIYLSSISLGALRFEPGYEDHINQIT
jgi:hypothetical protein